MLLPFAAGLNAGAPTPPPPPPPPTNYRVVVFSLQRATAGAVFSWQFIPRPLAGTSVALASNGVGVALASNGVGVALASNGVGVAYTAVRFGVDLH